MLLLNRKMFRQNNGKNEAVHNAFEFLLSFSKNIADTGANAEECDATEAPPRAQKAGNKNNHARQALLWKT